MKKRILQKRGVERITSVGLMKDVLAQEWGRITIEEINAEVAKLPSIMRVALLLKVEISIMLSSKSRQAWPPEQPS